MRQERASMRLTQIERKMIGTFAEQEGLPLSEAIRRLIFWARTPDFALSSPGQSPAQKEER
jgi:hypothetical protein